MRHHQLLVSMLLFAACTGSPTHQNQTLNQDSLIAAEQRIADSMAAENARQKALNDLSMSAYGGSKFGMSTEEVLQTEGFSGGTLTGEIIRPPANKRRVGNYNYDIEARFHENKLYLVTFGSAWQTAAFIEFDMVTLLNNLKDVIAIRYGEPNQRYKMPNVMDFEPGAHRWVYKWEIEDKVITIGMRESVAGANYQAIMWIYNKPIFDNIGYNKANVNKVMDAAKF